MTQKGSNMKFTRKLAGVVGLALALALTACASSNGSGTTPDSEADTPIVKVRYGSVGGMTDAPLYVAQERGYFKDLGLEVEMTRLASGTDILAAMVGQSLDVGAIAVSAGLLNAVKDSDNYVFVADRQSQQGPSGFGEGFLASKELVEGVDLDDDEALGQALKGKKVAITGLNTSTEYMVGQLMKSFGISNDEVELVVLPFAQMAAALQNGAIDAGIVLEPFRSQILESGTAVQISHLDGVISTGTQVPVTLTKTFASDKEAAGAFVEAYLHGVMDVTAALGPDEVDRDEIVKIISEYSDLPEAVIDQSDPPGYGKGPLNIEYMEDFQNFLVEKGVLPEAVDIAKAVDDSFAEAAREKLGIK